MNDAEAINLLSEASYEIKQLRQKNEVMAARLHMFDTMMELFHTEPYIQTQGMTIDLVYKMEKFIAWYNENKVSERESK